MSARGGSVEGPLAWAVACGLAGFAVDLLPGATGDLRGLLAGAAAGLVVGTAARRRTRWRYVPAGIAAAALVALGALATVRVGHAAPAAFTGVALVGLGGSQWVRRGREVLRAALATDPPDASRLASLVEGRLTPRAVRRTAAFALARERFRGEGPSAARAAFDGLADTVGRPPGLAEEAAVWAALCATLGGAPAPPRLPPTAGPEARALFDAVRILHVWRADGRDEAGRLAEHVVDGPSSALSIGLLAVLRDDPGLASAAVRRMLRVRGFLRHVPELEPLRGPDARRPADPEGGRA